MNTTNRNTNRSTSVLSLLVFNFIFWLSIMLINIYIHEVGHGVLMAISGWKHNLIYFGSAVPTEPELMVNTYQWFAQQAFKPHTFGTEQALQTIEYWGRTFPVIRLGLLGGWLGQLFVTFMLAILTQTRAFKDGASAFGKLFSLGYIVINTAWMGGNWLLLGLQEPRSSDPVILINVLLNRNPVAIGFLWLLALLMIALSVWLDHRFGKQMFSGFGLSDSESKNMASLWALISAIAGLSMRIPNLVLSLGVILFMVTAIPIFYLKHQQAKEKDAKFQIPGIVW